MKNISLYAAGIMMLGVGMTACDVDHNDLRLEIPTSYTLDTPEGADQLIVFGIRDSNVNNELQVTTYNPYNVVTNVDFQVQVARSADDFLTWDNLVAEELANGGDGSYDFTDSEGLPYVVTVSATYTRPSFTVPGPDFCDAINAVYGFETEEDATASPVQVAYRVHAWIPDVNYSSIFSNIVVLSEVKTYIPLREPRKIYLVGGPQGWNIESDSMYLLEVDPGYGIYKGTFNVPAGQFMFRFYTELGDWESNSLGSQVEDNPIDIAFEDDVYSGPVFDGKGSWNVPGWEGGKVEVTLDMNSYTIEMVAHEGELAPEGPKENVLYLIGAPQGWDINASDMYATETSTGSNVFKGIFDINPGEFQFRFYSALGNWETNSIGSQVEDNPVDIAFTDGLYSGECVNGKGSWKYADWAGGTIQVIIDLNEMTISISEYTEIRQLYIVGACQGWDINNDSMPLVETGVHTDVYSGTFDINSGDLQFKIYSELGNWDAHAYGSTSDGADTNTEIAVPYDGEVYPGKGNWQDPAFGGTLTITVDLKEMTIKMEPK